MIRVLVAEDMQILRDTLVSVLSLWDGPVLCCGGVELADRRV